MISADQAKSLSKRELPTVDELYKEPYAKLIKDINASIKLSSEQHALGIQSSLSLTIIWDEICDYFPEEENYYEFEDKVLGFIEYHYSAMGFYIVFQEGGEELIISWD